jgi:pantothenate kinase
MASMYQHRLTTIWLLLVAAARALRPDSNMSPTYQRLAERCVNLHTNLKRQVWIGITGGPGAGKSTVAEAVAAKCRDLGVRAAALPMDGFHFSKAKLRELDPPDAASLMPLRGAPQTFDAEAFCAAVADARRTGRCDAWPTYSRELSDPVEGGVVLSGEDAIVLCEGNYLLLGNLDGAEAERWRPLDFDESWFVRPQGGVPEQRDRVVERHLETWTAAKTAAWGAATAREGAERRADSNDVPNAYLVDRCRGFACLEVESL